MALEAFFWKNQNRSKWPENPKFTVWKTQFPCKSSFPSKRTSWDKYMLKRNCHICKPWDSLFFLKPSWIFHKKYKNRFFIKKITVFQEFRLPWIVKLAFWSPAARCILSLKAIKVRERATVSDIWNIIAWNVQSVLRWWEKQKLPNRFDYGSIVMWFPYICGFMKSSWYTDQTIFDPINWDLYRNHHRAQLQHVLIHSKLGEKLQSNNTFLLAPSGALIAIPTY